MKILCPVCALYLVVVEIESGEGRFFCERCLQESFKNKKLPRLYGGVALELTEGTE